MLSYSYDVNNSSLFSSSSLYNNVVSLVKFSIISFFTLLIFSVILDLLSFSSSFIEILLSFSFKIISDDTEDLGVFIFN